MEKAQLRRIKVKAIRVGDHHRPLNKKKMAVIAKSMDTIGLKTPITVHEDDDCYVLDVGLHRFEAAKSLEWSEIDCIVTTEKSIDRRLWREGRELASR
jgi:ParB-like chromosome segregation protein Spo0J